MFKVAILALCVLAAAARDVPSSHSPEFVAFVREYKKNYCPEAAWPCEESLKREAIFQDNLAKIEAHNSRNDVTYTMGVNQLADLTQEEFKAQYLGYVPSNEAREPTPFRYSNVEAPASADWRTKGAVTHIKNQGGCGSCWAFSAVGAVEGIHKIATGKLNKKVGFSEQELVSCDTTDSGCGGGLMDNAFTWIQSNGLTTETEYPYTGTDAPCDDAAVKKVHATIDGHEDVPTMDEDALMKAVSMQPVSVAIEADQSGFQLYKSGIFTGPCGTALDHGVLAVGYDTTGETSYWIIKNSWGETWGDEGYIKMVMGQNMCGIAMQPSYPTIDSVSQ